MGNLHTNLGDYLKTERERASMSLRDVEKKVDISNAYLSQLEKGKIKQPSPVVLHRLSELYHVSYANLLTLAGYPVPNQHAKPNTNEFLDRIGSISEDEEEALVEYLDFLRSRRGKGRS